LWFAANLETIYMCSSSVYAVLKLKDSCFNMCAMAEETKEFEIDSCICGYHVCWMLVIEEQLVCEGKREIQEIDIQ